MKANTENLDESRQLRTKLAGKDGKHGSETNSESESQLRSRLLEMILKSEQNRKDHTAVQLRHAIPTRHP